MRAIASFCFYTFITIAAHDSTCTWPCSIFFAYGWMSSWDFSGLHTDLPDLLSFICACLPLLFELGCENVVLQKCHNVGWGLYRFTTCYIIPGKTWWVETASIAIQDFARAFTTSMPIHLSLIGCFSTLPLTSTCYSMHIGASTGSHSKQEAVPAHAVWDLSCRRHICCVAFKWCRFCSRTCSHSCARARNSNKWPGFLCTKHWMEDCCDACWTDQRTSSVIRWH